MTTIIILRGYRKDCHMNTTVSLQKSFSYALLPVIILGVMAILGIVFLIIIPVLKKKHLEKKSKLHIKKVRPVNVEKLKAKYIAELEKIQSDFSSDKISTRHAYHRISACVRGFVHGVTGIRVQNATLADIKTLNMPLLETLIEEYYEPEFASKSEGDVNSSITKTKRVIEEWN